MVTGVRRLVDDRGSATIEMVILAPAFVLLIGMLIMGGRLAIAQQSIQSAAGEAARAASIERGSDAEERGREAAAAFLQEQGLQCASPLNVDLNVDGKDTDPGVAGQVVAATISCDVSLTGLGLPGVGASRTVTATANSPIDTYRER